VCSAADVPDEKILALDDYLRSPLFDERERAALAYADAMTLSGQDVDDSLFVRLQTQFDEPALIELTAVIAWENASSKFNRALRIGSQGLWRRKDGGG
jgi:alkylhydroperoxidase family enzyme